MKAKQEKPIVEKTESAEPKKSGEINFKQGKARFTSKKNNMGKNFMDFPDLKEDQKNGEGKLSDIQQQQRYLEDKYQVSSSAVGGRKPRDGEGEQKPEEKKEMKRPTFTGKAKLNKQPDNDDILTVKYDETKIASTAKGAKKDREENKSGEKDGDDEEQQHQGDDKEYKHKRNNRKKEFQDFDQDNQQ